MPSLFQTLNLKLAAWLRAAAARIEPRVGGTKASAVEASPAGFGPPAHWADRVRGMAPQLLEPEGAAPAARSPARPLSNPSPSRELLLTPPTTAPESRREEQRHQPVPASSQNRSAERTAVNHVVPTSRENEITPHDPVIRPAPTAPQPAYPIQPDRATISMESAPAATMAARREVRLRSSSSPEETPAPADARKRSPALRLSPAPRIDSAVEVVSSAPKVEPTRPGHRVSSGPGGLTEPASAAWRNPVRTDRMDATRTPDFASTQPSPASPEVRPVLPDRREPAPAVYPSLASASAMAPARFPSTLPSRRGEAPAFPAPASPAVQGERWPTLPVREPADLREDWLAWQRDSRHQARLDAEQQGLPWTV